MRASLALPLLVLLRCSPALGATFGDGALSLRFNEATGALTDVRVDAASVTGKQAAGGFFYREYPDGKPGPWRKLTGALSGGKLSAADGP